MTASVKFREDATWADMLQINNILRALAKGKDSPNEIIESAMHSPALSGVNNGNNVGASARFAAGIGEI